MKKFFRFALASLAIISLGTGLASARSNQAMTLGVAGGHASYNDGGRANIFLQVPMAPHVRLAPEMGYVFRNEGKSAFTAAIDVHFPFALANSVAIYPLTGVTLNSWNFRHSDDSVTRAGFDFGAGLDFALDRNLKLSIQGKYSMMNDTGGSFIDLGIGYNF